MSCIKLNLVDSQNALTGSVHASIADFCVAALAAEPETIAELESALTRFQKDPVELRSGTYLDDNLSIDAEPYDAGLFIVDLAARIVMCDSTYSQPGPSGIVKYKDGTANSDCPISYKLDDKEWLFVDSLDEYLINRDARRQTRAANPPLDYRPILYGRSLSEFIARSIMLELDHSRQDSNPILKTVHEDSEAQPNEVDELEPFSASVVAIHKNWLMTERDDLGSKSPREVMLAKLELIEFDMDSRTLQWSILLEGPPCLDRDSFAYRFAGYGNHEWVIYYDLVRFLILSGFHLAQDHNDVEKLTDKLDELKLQWLSEPNYELEGHIPFIVLDNERKRLPEAMGGRSMVVDEDCPICKMMGDEAEAGLGVYFWHLDGCNMERDYAFSTFRTFQEWEDEEMMFEAVAKRCTELDALNKSGEAWDEGIPIEPLLDEFVPWRPIEEEPPEA